MKQYECDLCGYVYDEAAGDPDNGIAPGTKWEDLPADLVCPCAAPERTSSPLSEKKSRVQRTRDFFFAQSGISSGKGLSGPSVRGLWAGPAAAGSPE